MKRISPLVSFFILMVTVVQAQWSTATLSQARYHLSATSVGTKVFFGGGNAGQSMSNVVDIYDNSTNIWTTSTLSQARSLLAATSVGTKAFFSGGVGNGGPSNVIDIYDNSTNTWTTAILSQARSNLTATSIGTKVFFAGGIGNGGPSNVVDIYDNSTNAWTTAILSQARSNLTATSVGTKVFFAGGDGNGGPSNVVDIYDNSTSSWGTATLSQARGSLSSATVGTKVFFSGGNANTVLSNAVDIYDNSTNSWSIATLSEAHSQLTATSVGTKVFFAGGISTGSYSNVVDIYDNNTNIWSTITLSLGRFGLSATSVGTKAFFAGGADNPLGSNLVDIYTIAPNIISFSPTTGASGDAVTLTGSFDPTPANNLVYFNGVAATVTASSFTSLTALVPSGSSTGPISVMVSDLTATSSTNFSVTGPTPQTITFGALVNRTYGNAPLNLTGTASSGLPMSYTSSNTDVATVTDPENDNVWTLTVIGAGTCTITASQPGDATYRAAPSVTRTLTVNKANQTISFANFTAKTYTSADFPLTATASSGLPITYTIANPTVAALVNGNTIDVLAVGSTLVTASQAGNNNYNPAPNISRTLNVTKAVQTITFASPGTKAFNTGSFQLAATTTSGLPITYTSANPAVATIIGDVVTFTGVGTSSITASQPGDGNYLAATNVVRTLTIVKGVQTIIFDALLPVNSWDAPFDLEATASSGLAVSFVSSNTSVATVSDTDGDNIWTVTPIAPGTTNITASQAGNVNWNAATNVARPLVVKAHQTISFGLLPGKNLGDAPFTLNATASSGLPVTYASSDPAIATISGNTVTIVGPGTAIITASQAGNDAFSGAPDVQQNLFVGLPAPTLPATFIEFSNVTETGMNIEFVPGNGNRHLVVIKPSSPVDFFTPVDNIFYSIGYTSNGSEVVMNEAGTLASATGLVPGTKYYVKVFEFNEVGSFTSYLTDCALSGAQVTLTTGGGSGARTKSSASSEATEEVDSESTELDLQILGNPFEKKLSFKVGSSKYPRASVSLTDLSGKVIQSSVVRTNSIIEIEKPMTEGVYLLKANTDSGYKIARVIKIN